MCCYVCGLLCVCFVQESFKARGKLPKNSLRARMTGLAGAGDREAGDQIPPGTPEALSRCSLSIFIYLACGRIFRHLSCQFGRRYGRPPADSNHNEQSQILQCRQQRTHTYRWHGLLLPWPRLPPPWVLRYLLNECVQNGNLLGWKNPETACKQAASHQTDMNNETDRTSFPSFSPATTGRPGPAASTRSIGQ